MVTALIIMTASALAAACSHRNTPANAEEEEFNRYSTIVQEAQDSGDYQKALLVGKELYEISQKGHSSLFRAHATTSYAQVLMVTGSSEEGKQILDELMQQSGDFMNDTVMATLYNAFGLYEMSAGDNVYAAAEYFLKALEYARQRNDKQILLGVLLNLDQAICESGDTTGIKYALESYEIASAIGNPLYQSIGCLALMGYMLKRNNYPEARKWMDEYLQLAPASEAITADMVKVKLYQGENDYAKANHYMDLVLQAADASDDMVTAQKSTIYYMKAALLARQHQYEESNKWLDRMMEYEQENHDKENEKDAINLYADNYEAMDNYRKALEYRNRYLKIVTDIANTDRIKILKAKEVALDVAQKDAEIEHHRDYAHMMKWLFRGAAAFCLVLAALSLYI